MGLTIDMNEGGENLVDTIFFCIVTVLTAISLGILKAFSASKITYVWQIFLWFLGLLLFCSRVVF